MSAFSDDFENVLADASVANGSSPHNSYVVPRHIYLDGSADETYNVTLYSKAQGSTTFSYSSSNDSKSTILSNLESSIDGSSYNVNAHRYKDPTDNNNSTLMIEQDSSRTNFIVNVSSTSGGTTMFLEPRVYGALYFNDPTDKDTGDEVLTASNNAGYERQPIPFNTASSGTIDNSSDVTFGPATGSNGWGSNQTISYVGVRDAHSSESNDFTSSSQANDMLLYHGPLSSSKTITQNDSFVFRSGDLDISLD